ncbi:tripeptidyl-peptidase I [Rhizoctonia solani]|uniref:tripeptidyl-peptidase II n=1 Tax=Rhizoctonia solani TaxID=456999 RepID=A0A8H8P0J6_9AGAM|nr:tripeptidyl-peptidase I [Rhizoctonia solani]QRW22865.1 tripeptidyl-peptidase I [Rhizoctonia solani]
MYVLTVLALASLVVASPVSQDFTTRHALREIPSGWTRVARAPADHNIDLRVGLKQARMTDLLAILDEVSNPASTKYGKHLSKEDVDKLVAPRGESVESVEKWLRSHGATVSGRSSAGDWIHVTVPVSRAEKMLGTKYNIYRHTSGTHIVRSESYALPRSLDSHIDVVQPTTYFGRINERSTAESSSELEKRASTVFVLPDSEDEKLKQVAEEPAGKVEAAVPSSCSSTITPACLKALYKTDSYTPKAGNSSSIGITGYLDQYASISDLQTFYTKFDSSAVGSTFSVELINGGKNTQTNPGIEANLDVQYAGAISHPIPLTFYSTGGSPPYKPDSNTPTNTNEPYLEWVNYMLNKTTLPLTISTSYGDDEQTVPLDYATRVCSSFAQLGVRGVSVLFSSGDGGVGSGTCKTNDGTNRTRFQPIFPASCPYVTAVGGTYKIAPEVGVSFSQGGFSDYFARPSYQTSAVSTFLGSIGTTYSGLYNTTGRGFPDVAAQGRSFQIIQKGSTTSVAGTSASAPAFAGVIALLNDYRLSQGKSPLGFLNPWLYSSAASALNDITSGSNPGCGTNGFTARAGWDPVTGLGTPDFVKLQAVA